MTLWKILLPVVLLALVLGGWRMWPRDREVPAESGKAMQPAKSESLTTSMARDTDAGRLRSVREAIATTPDGTTLDYKFAELILQVAGELSTGELTDAIALLDQVGFVIEELCMRESCSLERKIAILDRFGHREDQGVAEGMIATSQAYAEENPHETRAWLRQFEPGIGPGQGLEAVFRRLDETDPAASLRLLCELDDKEAENIIGYGDGPNLKHLRGREFLQLVGTFASNRLREFHLRQTVVWHLAEDDPEDALAYVRTLPAGERHASHGRQLVQAWTADESCRFADVMTRIETDLPVEVQSPETYRVLAEAWYDREPTALLAWISSVAPGTVRDAAIAGYARQGAVADPAATYTLALSMTDPALRLKTSGWAMRRWAISDPAAVAAALPDAELSDDDRRIIQRQLKRTER